MAEAIYGSPGKPPSYRNGLRTVAGLLMLRGMAGMEANVDLQKVQELEAQRIIAFDKLALLVKGEKVIVNGSPDERATETRIQELSKEVRKIGRKIGKERGWKDTEGS